MMPLTLGEMVLVVVVVVLLVLVAAATGAVVRFTPLDSPETPREIPLNHSRGRHMSGGISSQHTLRTISPILHDRPGHLPAAPALAARGNHLAAESPA